MPEFHLSSSYNTLLIVLAGGAALLVSLLVYRYTVPPVSPFTKIVLVALRTLGLFFLFLLIGKPLFSLLRRTTEPPVIALLMDNSKSMAMRDKLGDRKAQFFGALQSAPVQKLNTVGTLRPVVFDAKAKMLEKFSLDSLTLTGDATDIAGALKAAKQSAVTQNVQGIVLLTDGNSTIGTSPLYEAEEIGLPLFTIGIGDTSEQQDVLARKVLTNAITYVGNRVPVNATVKSSGYTNERVEVTLHEGGTVLDRKTISLQPGIREYAVPLSFTPAKEGMQKFSVEVSQLPGEVSYQNNRSVFFTKVLKSKMRVVLVAGASSPDVAFLRRSLESDKNIEVKSFIERKDGQFYEGTLSATVLQDADCIVLVGFPVASSSSSAVTLLLNAANAGKGMLFFASRTMDAEKLRQLEPVLPFSIQRQGRDEDQVFIAIPELQKNNPLIKLSSAGDVWSQLPPVFKLAGGFRSKPESEVIGQTRIQSVVTADPLLLSRNVNRRKSVAFLGYGLWRWKLFSGGIAGAENLLDEFTSNSVRWLTTREDERPVRVNPVKEVFAGQDPVEFTGQVYDENYKPIENAEVIITVTRDNASNQTTLTPLGSGRYEGSLEPMQEGDYTFTATVNVGGKQLAEDKGTFSVGGLNVEFQETRMNKLLLQQLAARTGGKYYNANALENLPQDIASLPHFKPREVVHASEIELWNIGWMITLMVTLFALEWFMRKRNGML